ncbi:phage major capsid protein [Collinsella sp. TF10-11AT]|uniref:phage major capsid protein n=1 Tax=Collinsella sp. TF10-11AT TaxID=2292335 RepID=UPI000E443670|nr:phage major capsid protein [Collinsella sp. TF10-11AT]RGK64677.1 phage major capsid protein [Collinsella sp. TF10-11AT]
MTLEDLIAELQALIDQYSDGTEPTEEDAARMAELTDEISQRRAADEHAAQTRAAAVVNARAAIDAGRAQRIDSVPLARSANVASVSGAAYDVTDYDQAERRAWVKNMAERSNVQLFGGNALTDAERAAMRHALEQRAEFTITTSNTADVVPVSVQQEIISLIDNSAVLFSDVTRYNMAGQFELVRHKSIKKGDAAETAEGAAPTDIEENEFDHITLTGDEIKKTVEMSRKMATQSLTGFEKYLISEISARLSVACNAKVHANLDSAELGMATANKIQTAKANVIAKADILKLLSLLMTFGNPAPKGAFIYANNNTIWNQLAAIEDATGRSYFVSEATDDPTVQGRMFGKWVKKDDSIADGVIKAGFPDLFRGNIFDGVDVTPYIQQRTQKRCYDGYVLYDGGLAVPQAFSQLTVKTA